MEIPKTGTYAPPPPAPAHVDQANETAKGQGTSSETKEIVQNVLTVISGVLNAYAQNRAASASDKDVGSQNTVTGRPSIDIPSDPEAVRENLEALLAYLKLENDEQQAATAQERIKLQGNELEKTHAEQKAKLEDSFKQMEKAAKASLLTKIFGWMMAALAVVFAVAACVATGGLAVGAVVGAAVALGMAILNETGAMEKITEALTDELKKAGLSEQSAAILAAVIIAVGTIVLTLASGEIASAIAKGVAKIAAKAAMTAAQTAAQTATQAATTVATEASKSAIQVAAKVVQEVLENVMKAMGAATTVAGGVAAFEGFKAGMAQADVTEMDKFLAIMRQRLEESQEELNAILEQIQGAIADIINILNSATDNQKEIAQQMGMMTA